jgi:hypothetical protein
MDDLTKCKQIKDTEIILRNTSPTSALLHFDRWAFGGAVVGLDRMVSGRKKSHTPAEVNHDGGLQKLGAWYHIRADMIQSS